MYAQTHYTTNKMCLCVCMCAMMPHLRVAESLEKYLKCQYIAMSSLNLLNVVQNVLIGMGTLGGAILVVYDVHAGRLTVGT